MINFNTRLNSLKERRQGSREYAIHEAMDSGDMESFATSEAMDSGDMESFATSEAIPKGYDVREPESYELLREKAGVKYTIGAMAAVERKYTEKSIAEGERVADSLIKSLSEIREREDVIKRIQGSVALDIHIKGHSDVDMLILVRNPVNVELPRVYEGVYFPATDPRPLLDIVRDVREKSENILPVNFPAVTVDCSNNKSISMEGRGLQRKVDIVPAIWFDSIPYQKSQQEHDRGVKIYNKGDHELILNYPFKHIKLINEKDSLCSGNLKRVIRLMKNLVADMPDYKKQVAKKLSSFDLAAIAYIMSYDELNLPSYAQLGLVEQLRTHLFRLSILDDYRNAQNVPDGTRKIFDSDQKVAALKVLKDEVDALAQAIYKELCPYSDHYDSSEFRRKQITL